MLTPAISDSFEDHIQSVHGSLSLARSFPASILSPGLFDYIAFIAMIILKDRSTLTGIVFPGTDTHFARFFNSCGRAGTLSVQLHSGRYTVRRAAQGEA